MSDQDDLFERGLSGLEPTQAGDCIRIYVDEAGDSTLFHSSGKQIVGTQGCSRFFIMGKLEVDDPAALTCKLTDLRHSLLADPYFRDVESFRPERRKTALKFHAKDDLPEVRYSVFDLLCAEGSGLRFHAVVRDKAAIACAESTKRDLDPRYRYQPNALYDSLVRSLFGKFHRLADSYQLCIARRGNKDRTKALTAAIEQAERDFERTYGFSRGGTAAWRITVSDPVETASLQAVDYFLWALQRFYETRKHPETGEEKREDRFLLKLWPQIIEVHDLDFGREQGTFYRQQRPLMLEERFGDWDRKKRKKGS